MSDDQNQNEEPEIDLKSYLDEKASNSPLPGIEKEVLQGTRFEDWKSAKLFVKIFSTWFIRRRILYGKDNQTRLDAMEYAWINPSPTTISALLITLRDPNDEVRCSAVLVLGKIANKKAVRPLIAQLNDESPMVRLVAIWALVSIGDKRSIEGLIARLEDQEESIRAEAARALAKFKQTKYLIGALKNKSGKVRTIAAQALGTIPSKKAIKPLIQALLDNDPEVRAAAAESLGKMKAKKAIKPLIATLEDRKPEVRVAASRALGMIGDHSAANALLQIIRSENIEFRASALESLGMLGGPEAYRTLLNALSDSSPTIRTAAADGLGFLGDDRASDALLDALSDSDDLVRASAVDALSSIRCGRAFEPVFELLSDISPFVRMAAGQALEKIAQKALSDLGDAGVEAVGDQTLNALMLLFASYSHRDERLRALEQLAISKDDRALEAILYAVDAKDWNVQPKAIVALGQIGGFRATAKLMRIVRGGYPIDVKTLALETLARTGDPEVSAFLVEMLGNSMSSALKVVTQRLLEPLAEENPDSLLTALNHNDDRIRSGAATILGKSGSDQAFDALIPLLDDPAESVRQTALGALINAGEPAKNLLRVKLAMSSGTLHDQINEALKKF